jgi:FtsZ-interacting cell division protein ZipA
LQAYNTSIVKGPFQVALIVACISILPALGVEWRSTRERLPPKGGAPATGKKQTSDEETADKVKDDEHVEKAKDMGPASVEVESPVAKKQTDGL